ncbi:single-stranded DNA-binding protein [Nesterenkonia jeotgali]|uniref:Single-stranded DNA-binding protein n=1 Tax=Nesterenkonia jeotgali TaxID=317018 RepID=A0A0W8IG66_9MICC|nr:single-stranded DNA-binding protein [Nesterenkonia jeotgali]KUG58951.1 hypothetical protein AVL63_02710 [Nesterenkonia jeotgali]
MHTTVITANLTHDPDGLRHVGDAAVLNLNVAVNRREKVRGEWQDGEPTFYRLNLWRELAINAAESLRKGQEVLVMGTAKTRSWEQDGQKRSAQEIDVDAIGPNLKFQTTTAQRVQKDGAQRSQSSGFPATAAPQDPWGGSSSGGGSWGAPGAGPAPF